MHCFDSAEILELGSVYVLNILSEKYGKEKTNLYRDNV